MAYEQPFSDPLLYLKRGKDQPYLEIIEEVYVDDKSKVLLTEIPYRYDRVQILEQTGGSGDTNSVDGGSFTDSTTTGSETIIFPTMYEITDGAPSDNQFVCDYTEGILTFNSSQIGAKFKVKYTGTGFHYVSSGRIYYEKNLDGSITTIKQVLDSSMTTINNIQNAMDNANTATNNANSATADFQSLLDQQLVIPKVSVATFTDIAITYPNPALGWTVTEKQYGIQYRYDGTAWKEIGTSQAGEGFNVYVGESAPANPNILWLEVPNADRMTRIIKSDTPPADTSVIWWEP